MTLPDLSYHPANLAFRFLLEIAALTGFALYAHAGWGLMVAILTGVGVAVLWGVFNVPGDRSRSGEAPVAVPGALRLMLELAILLGGGMALLDRGSETPGIALIVATLVHYTVSRQRLRWLLGH